MEFARGRTASIITQSLGSLGTHQLSLRGALALRKACSSGCREAKIQVAMPEMMLITTMGTATMNTGTNI